MAAIFLWIIVFSISSTGTTVLLGDRNILSGNLLEYNKLISILFHWRFITGMILAFLARYSFMLINSNLLKYPNLAQNSTTITALVTSVVFIFLIIGNYIFLGERIDLRQWLGALLIMIGITLVIR